MGTGIWSTLLEYCTSKPPIIIFFISVVAFALTLAGLSISIELNKGRIFNPDIRSWNVFYNSVSQLGICFNSYNQSSSSLNEENRRPKEFHYQRTRHDLNNTKVSFVSDDVSLSIIGGHLDLISIHGFIQSDDIGFGSTHDSYEIEITIAPLNSNAKKAKTCLTISGPTVILPNAQVPKPSCSQDKNLLPEEVVFMPFWKVESKEFCSSGIYGKLSLKEREELNVYISEIDTSLIQLHIFFTSSVLCVTLTAILLCALFGRFCKRELTKNVESEKSVQQMPILLRNMTSQKLTKGECVLDKKAASGFW